MNNYNISSQSNKNSTLSFKAFHAPSHMPNGAQKLKSIVGLSKAPEQMDIVELMHADLKKGHLGEAQVDKLKSSLKERGIETSYLNFRDKAKHGVIKHHGRDFFDFYHGAIQDSKAISEAQLSKWESVKENCPKWLYKIFDSLEGFSE